MHILSIIVRYGVIVLVVVNADGVDDYITLLPRN